MAEELRVNLGCGSAYRPGFINVDKYKESVADLVADASLLPFSRNSMDCIEATQLVEHFDLVHLRYVLAEWLLVLKPGAELGIETPDLTRSFKKLLRSKDEQSRTTLQWIFGIDSPGLQHKSGFIFEHLKRELEHAGFCEVVREKESTHTYEPGIRIRCRKKLDPEKELFSAGLRSRVRRLIGDQGSFVLIPLEKWIENARTPASEVSTRKNLHEMIAALAPCNPTIAIALLDEAVASKAFGEQEVSEERALLNELAGMRFHERAFELWTRNRKGSDVNLEFSSFISRMSSALLAALETPGLLRERMEYVLTLDPRPIPLLDLELVLQEAQRSFSEGVRAFCRGDLERAESRFADSLRINPTNPLACWNLARLSIVSGRSSETVTRLYREAIGLVRDAGVKMRMESELAHFARGTMEVAQTAPVCDL